MTNQLNFDLLRLRLGIRKAMLCFGDRECHRSVLMNKFPWANRELVAEGIAEGLRDGVLTERFSDRGASILTWHEDIRQEKARQEILATAKVTA